MKTLLLVADGCAPGGLCRTLTLYRLDVFPGGG
jgi:hypothetical protein